MGALNDFILCFTKRYVSLLSLPIIISCGASNDSPSIAAAIEAPNATSITTGELSEARDSDTQSQAAITEGNTLQLNSTAEASSEAQQLSLIHI